MIHMNDQLSHYRSQSYFTGLVAFLEALIERRQDGIAAAGAEGCHVKDGTHLGASTPDTAFAFHRATIARPRG